MAVAAVPVVKVLIFARRVGLILRTRMGNPNQNHLGSFSYTTPRSTTLHFLKSHPQPIQNRTQSPHRHTPWYVAIATFTSFSILFVPCTQSAVLFGCFRKFFLHILYLNLTTHRHPHDSHLYYNVFHPIQHQFKHSPTPQQSFKDKKQTCFFPPKIIV